MAGARLRPPPQPSPARGAGEGRARGVSRGRVGTLVAFLALLAAAACGVKNPPELPPGQEDQYPRQYPASDEP